MSTFPATADLPQTGSIVSRWLLDEASGTRADIVGSNNLTDTNTVEVSAGLVVANGIYDNSAKFVAANNESLQIADASQTGLDGLSAQTVSFWVKMATLGTERIIVGKWAGGQRSYVCRILADNKLEFVVDQNGDSITKATVVSDNTITTEFAFVTMVFDGSTRMEIYINGVPDGTNTTSIPTGCFNGTAAFSCGLLAAGSTYMNGDLQDVVFWNTPLTDSEVLSLYQDFTVSTAVSGRRAFAGFM